MTAKKLTDDEIVKRLELCVHRGNKNYNTDLVLDLINRQQADIERLQKKVEELSEVLSDSIRIRYKEAKSEAVKEFAERVKETNLYEFIEEYFENAESCYEVRHDQFYEHINNLVKEMESENNG